MVVVRSLVDEMVDIVVNVVVPLGVEVAASVVVALAFEVVDGVPVVVEVVVVVGEILADVWANPVVDVDKDVIPDKVGVVAIETVADVVVIGALVVDFHVQLNQSPLLNCEYTRTLASFDK